MTYALEGRPMASLSPARRAVHQLFTSLNASQVWMRWRWLHKLFLLWNPQPLFHVRGVPIRVFLPLGQLGIFDTARNWERREPETLDWIDAMRSADVFFDIGASFGTETLYAARKKDGPGKIVAFDCDLLPSHYLALNLRLNHIHKVEFFFLALGDGSRPIEFSCPSNIFLSGRHHLSAPENSISYRLWSLMLDDFCQARQLRPTHVKIDVDGRELEVLSGMRGILDDPGLKSLLVEVRPDTIALVVDRLESNGFRTPASVEVVGESANLVFNR
jgi:FkbM family methyltransferase